MTPKKKIIVKEDEERWLSAKAAAEYIRIGKFYI